MIDTDAPNLSGVISILVDVDSSLRIPMFLVYNTYMRSQLACAEFHAHQGVFFCGWRYAQLSVKLLKASSLSLCYLPQNNEQAHQTSSLHSLLKVATSWLIRQAHWQRIRWIQTAGHHHHQRHGKCAQKFHLWHFWLSTLWTQVDVAAHDAWTQG